MVDGVEDAGQGGTGPAAADAAGATGARPGDPVVDASGADLGADQIAGDGADYVPLYGPGDGDPRSIRESEFGVTVLRAAERLRVRHNLSPEDFNNFNIDYWDRRWVRYELRDLVDDSLADQRATALVLNIPGCGATPDPGCGGAPFM